MRAFLFLFGLLVQDASAQEALCASSAVAHVAFESLLKAEAQSQDPGIQLQLIRAAQVRFERAGVQVSAKQIGGRPVLVVEPSGDALLNRLSRAFSENGSARHLVYDPVYLRMNRAHAAFDPVRSRESSTTLFLPAHAPLAPSDLRSFSLGHEVWHAKLEQDLRQGVSSVFHGRMVLVQGESLPGATPSFYADLMGVDEVKTFSVSLREDIERLNQAILGGPARVPELMAQLKRHAGSLSLAAQRVFGVSRQLENALKEILRGKRATRSGTYAFGPPPHELLIRVLDGKELGPDLAGRNFARIMVREFESERSSRVTREFLYEFPLFSSSGPSDPKNMIRIAEALSERAEMAEWGYAQAQFSAALGRALEAISDPDMQKEISNWLVRRLRAGVRGERDLAIARALSEPGWVRESGRDFWLRKRVTYTHPGRNEKFHLGADGEIMP